MERRGNIPLLPNVNQFAEEMKKNRLVVVVCESGGGETLRAKSVSISYPTEMGSDSQHSLTLRRREAWIHFRPPSDH